MPTYRSNQGRVGPLNYYVTGATIPVRTPGELVLDDCNGVLINREDAVMQRGRWVHSNPRWGGWDKPGDELGRVW